MKINELQQELSKITDLQLKKLDWLVHKYEKVIILGNGGSSAIAGHISQDWTKNLKKNCLTFEGHSRLTCYANDYGWEKAYEQFVKEFADQQTLVILISSSGESKNIFNCACYCEVSNIPFITLSGFDRDNLLTRTFRNTSLLDFHVDSRDYGVVELTHEAFLHSLC